MNAEQHHRPTPPDVEHPQLRPVTLDQLLGTRCAQLVIAAGMRGKGGSLNLVKHSLLERSHHNAALTKCQASAALASVQLQGAPQLLPAASRNCMEGCADIRGVFRAFLQSCCPAESRAHRTSSHQMLRSRSSGQSPLTSSSAPALPSWLRLQE